MDGKEFDFVVYGASGFTGQYVVEELIRVIEESGKGYKWAVSGRSHAKLQATLEKIQSETGNDVTGVTKIIADSGDEESLAKMAEQTKVVLNCVGPYRFYGEPVVKACVNAGTSHVDISGEPWVNVYLEKMERDYMETAKKNKAYVVGACGWDSIPFEMGIDTLEKQFDQAGGELNDVEGVVQNFGAPGYKINYGTFSSLIHGIANRNDLKPIRKAIMPSRPPTGKFKIPKRSVLHFHPLSEGWCLPFLGSDKSVAQRTQFHKYEAAKESDSQGQRKAVQVNTYMKFTSALMAVAVAIWGVCFAIAASFKPLRDLLAGYPEIVSFGMFSHQGPTRAQMEGTTFVYELFGRGYKDRKPASDGGDRTEPPKENVVVKVTGPDPGYLATSIFLVASAMTIREDADKMPGDGGVLPPGAAFSETKLADRLRGRGIGIEVVHSSLDGK